MAVGINILNKHGHLNKDATRAFFAARGKLPAMKKGTLCYVLAHDGTYELVELTRRHPGEIWSGRAKGRPRVVDYRTVSVTNFGGVVAP